MHGQFHCGFMQRRRAIMHAGQRQISERMSKVRRAGTKPEVMFRRTCRRLGLTYRTNVRGLPGSPDVVLPEMGVAFFVHGCFWHRHPGCSRATTPKTNLNYWESKFDANVRRDRKKCRHLRKLGWRVHTVWECQVYDEANFQRKLISRLRRTSGGLDEGDPAE